MVSELFSLAGEVVAARQKRASVNPLILSHRPPRRLSGLDAIFLNLETTAQPMRCVALGILRPGADGALTIENLLARLAARLHELPALRWRIVRIPFGLAHPVLVEDRHLDLAQHVSHLLVGRPGGPQQLNAVCAQLAFQYLNLNRPPWHITLIDGLGDGRQAVVVQIHHALMDGFVFRATLAQIFSDIPAAPLLASDQPWRTPRPARLIIEALTHQARTFARLPKLIGRTRRAVVAVRRRKAAAAVKIPKAGVDPPLSVINQGFTTECRFARATVSLDRVLAVKKVVSGATVNDVALALVGGALRSYLQQRGVLPDRPLVALVPVGHDKPGGLPRASGNRLSFLVTSLGTDVADPWQRLRKISMIAAEAKACLELEGRGLLMDWLDVVPPMLMGRLLRRGLAASLRPDKQVIPSHNVVVSNFRGSSVAWRLGSAVVEEMYVVPPCSGIGVNFVLWDYAGSLMFGIMSFAESVEDAEELAWRLSQSLDEFATGAPEPCGVAQGRSEQLRQVFGRGRGTAGSGEGALHVSRGGPVRRLVQHGGEGVA